MHSCSNVWRRLMQFFLHLPHATGVAPAFVISSSCFRAAHPLSTRRWLAAQRIANHFFPFHFISFFATVFPPHAQGCFTAHALSTHIEPRTIAQHLPRPPFLRAWSILFYKRYAQANRTSKYLL